MSGFLALAPGVGAQSRANEAASPDGGLAPACRDRHVFGMASRDPE